MDAEAAAEFEENVRGMYDQMARIAITPRWVRYYDFGAGRMPRFLQELAELISRLGGRPVRLPPIELVPGQTDRAVRPAGPELLGAAQISPVTSFESMRWR